MKVEKTRRHECVFWVVGWGASVPLTKTENEKWQKPEVLPVQHRPCMRYQRWFCEGEKEDGEGMHIAGMGRRATASYKESLTR
jgi:hypothetical protein